MSNTTSSGAMDNRPMYALDTIPPEVAQQIIKYVDSDHRTIDSLSLVSTGTRDRERISRSRLVFRYEHMPAKFTRKLSKSFPAARCIVVKKRRAFPGERNPDLAQSKDIIKNGLLDGTSVTALALHNMPRNELRSLCTQTEHLSNLWCLNLSGSKGLSDRILQSILDSAGKLRELDISECTSLTLTGILSALRHPTLVKLTAARLIVTNEPATPYLEVSRAIKHLDISKTTIPHDIVLGVISLAPGIEVLDLSYYAHQTNDILCAASKLESLRELSLDGWTAAAIDFSHIANMHNLRALSLNVCWQFGSESVQYLLGLCQLETLNMSHCNVTVNDLRRLVVDTKSPSLHLKVWTSQREYAKALLGHLVGSSQFMYRCDVCSDHGQVLSAIFFSADCKRVLCIDHPKDSAQERTPSIALHKTWT